MDSVFFCVLSSLFWPVVQGCLEKSDMIVRLLSSGFVDIVAADGAGPSSPKSPSTSGSTSGSVEGKGVPSMKMGDLQGMPLSELRRLMGEVRDSPSKSSIHYSI
jgi:hypothetical protein